MKKSISEGIKARIGNGDKEGALTQIMKKFRKGGKGKKEEEGRGKIKKGEKP